MTPAVALLCLCVLALALVAMRQRSELSGLATRIKALETLNTDDRLTVLNARVVELRERLADEIARNEQYELRVASSRRPQ